MVLQAIVSAATEIVRVWAQRAADASCGRLASRCGLYQGQSVLAVIIVSVRYPLSALAVAALVLLPNSAASQEITMEQTLPRITKIQPVPSNESAQFGGLLKIQLDELLQIQQNEEFTADDFVLYLNEHRMHHLPAQIAHDDNNAIVFKLATDNSNLTEPEREALRQAWRDVLGSPKPIVRLAVGLNYDGKPLGYAGVGNGGAPQILFRAYRQWIFVLGVVLFAVLVVAFIYLARKSDIIRDSGPLRGLSESRRPYSLGRTQMAFWTLLVLGAWGFIYIVMEDYQTINEQALVLLGIAAATALGAAAIDTTKSSTVSTEFNRLEPERAKVNAELGEIRKRIGELKTELDTAIAQYAGRNQPLTLEEQKAIDDKKELVRRESVAEPEKAAELKRLDEQIELNKSYLTPRSSEGFWRDLITDKDGVALHRFQIALWTVALGVLFVWEVWERLAMPAFSTELLALMGISSGTYLGFKWPERQSD